MQGIAAFVQYRNIYSKEQHFIELLNDVDTDLIHDFCSFPDNCHN